MDSAFLKKKTNIKPNQKDLKCSNVPFTLSKFLKYAKPLSREFVRLVNNNAGNTVEVSDMSGYVIGFLALVLDQSEEVLVLAWGSQRSTTTRCNKKILHIEYRQLLT